MKNTTSLQNQLLLRDKLPADDNFILSSWVQSYRHNPLFGAMPVDLYFSRYRKHALNILERSYAHVAADPTDPNVVFGYCIYRFIGDVPVVSYIYVKQAFRRFGIATILLNKVSTETKLVTSMMPKLEAWAKKMNCIFDPFSEI
jgi:GNAT superfamily N-acetyltransferase